MQPYIALLLDGMSDSFPTGGVPASAPVSASASASQTDSGGAGDDEGEGPRAGTTEGEAPSPATVPKAKRTNTTRLCLRDRAIGTCCV